MRPITLSLGFLALVFVVGFVTDWIRHRPINLTRGTQHIVLIGLVFQAGFLGAAIIFLIRGCIRAFP